MPAGLLRQQGPIAHRIERPGASCPPQRELEARRTSCLRGPLRNTSRVGELQIGVWCGPAGPGTWLARAGRAPTSSGEEPPRRRTEASSLLSASAGMEARVPHGEFQGPADPADGRPQRTGAPACQGGRRRATDPPRQPRQRRIADRDHEPRRQPKPGTREARHPWSDAVADDGWLNYCSARLHGAPLGRIDAAYAPRASRCRVPVKKTPSKSGSRSPGRSLPSTRQSPVTSCPSKCLGVLGERGRRHGQGAELILGRIDGRPTGRVPRGRVRPPGPPRAPPSAGGRKDRKRPPGRTSCRTGQRAQRERRTPSVWQQRGALRREPERIVPILAERGVDVGLGQRSTGSLATRALRRRSHRKPTTPGRGRHGICDRAAPVVELGPHRCPARSRRKPRS